MSELLVVLRDVARERKRQIEKWGDQSHLPDGTGSAPLRYAADHARDYCDRVFREGRGTFLHILTEEVAEALAESDHTRLRAELIQVAAVCVQWVQAIDGRES